MAPCITKDVVKISLCGNIQVGHSIASSLSFINNSVTHGLHRRICDRTEGSCHNKEGHGIASWECLT